MENSPLEIFIVAILSLNLALRDFVEEFFGIKESIPGTNQRNRQVLARISWSVMEHLYRFAKFPINISLVAFNVLLNKYRQDKAQLLIDRVTIIFSFSFLPQERQQLLLSNLNFFISSYEDYIPQVVWQIQKWMPQIFPYSLVLLDSYFAGVDKGLDFFHICHDEIAVNLLYQNRLHHDGL